MTGRRLLVSVAVAVGLASALLIWRTAATPAEGPGVVRPTERRTARAWTAAAKQAFGLRVLVIEEGGDGVSATVYDSAQLGGGWGLVELPRSGDSAVAGFGAIESRVAFEFSSSRALSGDVARALRQSGVAVIVLRGETSVASLEKLARPPELEYLPACGGLRVRGAEVVWRVDGDARTPAPVLDLSDTAGGGEVTVEVESAGRYVFCWSPAGDITVNGDVTGPATRSETAFGLDLPAGRTVVRAGGPPVTSRSVWLVVGALGIVGSLIALLRLLRPRLEHDA